MSDEHRVQFGVLGPDGYTETRTLRQASMLACRFTIMDPSHYRDDETCKCDDPDERARMIREWDYTPSDFEGIPLRTEGTHGHDA